MARAPLRLNGLAPGIALVAVSAALLLCIDLIPALWTGQIVLSGAGLVAGLVLLVRGRSVRPRASAAAGLVLAPVLLVCGVRLWDASPGLEYRQLVRQHEFQEADSTLYVFRIPDYPKNDLVLYERRGGAIWMSEVGHVWDATVIDLDVEGEIARLTVRDDAWLLPGTRTRVVFFRASDGQLQVRGG